MEFNIIYYEKVESTNSIAVKMAKNNASEGHVIVADEQTAGRGRFNRHWHSPKGSGLWFSIILRPKLEAERVSQLTMVAALAVAEAVENLYGISLGLKWPNDLLVDGKKVCGILSEGSFISRGTGNGNAQIAYVVIGIGLNIRPEPTGRETIAYLEDYLADDDDLAGSDDLACGDDLAGGSSREANRKVDKVDKDQLLNEILKSFESWYEKRPTSVVSEAKKRSVTLGEEVEVDTFNDVFIGKAIDINESGALVVEATDGEIMSFNSGEVSLRKRWEK